MQKDVQVHNFENTEGWEDKASNIYKLGNSKLASPQFIIFACLKKCAKVGNKSSYSI